MAEENICELHQVPLEEREVPLRYGLQMQDPARQVKQDLFPNAHSYGLGGCMLPEEPIPTMPVCLECREAERLWREIHDPPLSNKLSDLFAIAYREFKSKDS
jgi:hypothetical protein